MKVTLENGILCLWSNNGDLFARNLTAEIQYTGDWMATLFARAQGAWVLEGNTAKCRNVTLEFVPRGEGMLVRTAFVNTVEPIPQAGTFRALKMQTRSLPRTALVNRPHRCNGGELWDMQSQCELVTLRWGTKVLSCDNTALTFDNTNAIVGFVTAERYFSRIGIGGDGSLSAEQLTEGHTVETGETLLSDWLYIAPCGDITEELPRFGKLCAEAAGAPKPRFPVPFGFCSWYYYKNYVAPDDVAEHTRWFAKNRTALPVQVIQIDDGWAGEWGDWNENEKFKGKMKALAEDITKNGFTPGIWFCPIGATENSELFKNHPAYFVKDKTGNPQRGENGKYCLDFSQKEVCEHLRRLIRRFTEEWGYKYIKMDIISPTLCPGIHKDKSFNSLRNYRKCLQTVREAAGKDVFLLGCTAPFLAACGLVDGMRTSGDVFDSWECLPWIFPRVLKRYWLSAFYHLDADCLIVRTKQEEDALCRRPCSRNTEELKTFVTAMGASGGALMLADKMPLLKDWQFALIRSLLPLNTAPALPLDITENEHPCVLDFGLHNGVRTVAVINWEEREQTFSVPRSAGKFAYEFWSQRVIGTCNENLNEEVAPHCCKVYHLYNNEQAFQNASHTALTAGLAE